MQLLIAARQRGFIAALGALTLWMAGPAAAQTTPDSGETSAPVAGPARLPVVFRGLSSTDTVRVGPIGSDTPENAAVTGGSAQSDLEFGRAYELQWGDATAPERLRYYVPRPADGGAPSVPVEIALRHGMRGVPDETWSYPWAPGENQKLAEYAPPPAAPVVTPRPQPRQRPATDVERPVQPAVAPGPNLEPRVAALEAALPSLRGSDDTAARSAMVVGACSLALAAIALVAGLSFFFGVWRPHQAAVSQALQRSLPNALRAQSQEIATLNKQIDATQRQWEQDRDALRRGQELVAAHAMPRPGAVSEADALRRDLDEVRRSVRELAARSANGGAGA
jgi:hypothetical protein